MAGNDLIRGIGDTYQGPTHLTVRITHGFEKGSVWCPVNPFFYLITFHLFSLKMPKIIFQDFIIINPAIKQATQSCRTCS
jgi:hypothetical protein